MKYEDVLKRFVSNQAQLLQEKQMKQQLQEKMLEVQSQGLRSFVPGMQGHSPEEEYTETEHNPFEEGQEFKAGGINIDPKKKGTFKAQATRMGMSIQEAASHILNNKEKYTSTMVKKANFAKNFAKEEGGQMACPDGMYWDGSKCVEIQKEISDRKMNVNFSNPPSYTVSDQSGNSIYEGRDNERAKGFYAKGPSYITVPPEGVSKESTYMDPVKQLENINNVDILNRMLLEQQTPKNQEQIMRLQQMDDMRKRMEQSNSWENLKTKQSGGMFTGDYEYPDGGLIRSMVENTSGPRAEEVDVPLDYQSFIESDVYQPNEKEKIFDTWGEGDNQRTIKGAFYRKNGDKMAIDRLKALYPDGITREEPYDYFNGMHRKFQNELLNTSVNDYGNYKASFLKNEIEGDIPKYADTEDIVKRAHEHNLKNNYDDTDIITSHLGNQAKKEGLDIYDFMAKYYGGSSPNAVARQLLVDYSKKMKK